MSGGKLEESGLVFTESLQFLKTDWYLKKFLVKRCDSSCSCFHYGKKP